MDDPTVSLRFALLLEAYLRGCGVFMDDFARQTDVLTKLSDAATAIKRVKTGIERKEVLHQELIRMNLPSNFQLALDPRLEGKGLRIEKCKYMDSKKVRFKAF
jgi:phosphatidylinositol-4,5-bisphosphate 3-kinase catalytic subunit alpha/beta/delta